MKLERISDIYMNKLDKEVSTQGESLDLNGEISVKPFRRTFSTWRRVDSVIQLVSKYNDTFNFKVIVDYFETRIFLKANKNP